MSDLKIFDNEEFGEVRTTEVGGKIYFVGIDVAKILGYSNPSKAVIQHCKGVTKLGIPSEGGIQETNCISEGDLYRLITHSKLPSAERFERWVFDEVLPSIRKHGMYAKEELLNNPDLLISVAQELKAEREHNKLLGEQLVEQQKVISELKPKANYVDMILQSKSLVLMTQIAKDYGMSAKALNKILKNMGVQYKVNDQWVLYSKYQGKGYVHSRTIDITRADGRPDVKMQTEWTQKGRLFLYELLKKHGVVPVIEKGYEQVELSVC